MENTIIKKSGILTILLFAITGCLGGNSSPTSSSVNNEPTFTNKIEGSLVDGEDYVDHAYTFDGENFVYDESMWYYNRLDQVPLPDPHVFVENGTYYIVGTSDRSVCKFVDCYYTKDFVTFEKAYNIFDPKSFNGWEDSNPLVYAPEMYCFDGVYYLYYSAMDKSNRRHNSVVKADNPLGPYEPIVNDEVDGLHNPLFDYGGNTVLDASIFVDDDGSMYMYYSEVDNGQILSGVKLKSPYEADWSTYKKLARASEKSTEDKEQALYWESMRKGSPIVEAPYMIKSPNGQYYLTYSANGCWNKYYNVCYAISDDPLGNFVKPYEEGKIWTNLLMGYPGDNDPESELFNQWAGFASGTGHHCFFNIGDQIMIGYHAHQNRDWDKNGFTPRYFAMDPLYFNDEGVPYVNGPTYSLQPLPEAISGYKNVALNATIRSENVENEKAINDNYIVSYYNLDTPSNEVILNGKYAYIELTFDKEYEIGGIAVYNSAYYEKAVSNINYIDFGNGNAVKNVEFPYNYFNYDYEFIFPNSAFTYEFTKTFKSNKVTLCFGVSDPLQINEIVVLGK